MKSIIPWKRWKSDLTPSKTGSLLDRFWGKDMNDFFSSPFTTNLPAIDVSEKNGQVTVRAEVPGLSEKDLELTFQDGVLHIRGEKKEEHKEEKKHSYYRECRYGSFSRAVPLPKGVRWEDAKARFKNGVLTVSFEKKEAEGKPISIKVD